MWHSTAIKNYGLLIDYLSSIRFPHIKSASNDKDIQDVVNVIGSMTPSRESMSCRSMLLSRMRALLSVRKSRGIASHLPHFHVFIYLQSTSDVRSCPMRTLLIHVRKLSCSLITKGHIPSLNIRILDALINADQRYGPRKSHRYRLTLPRSRLLPR